MSTTTKIVWILLGMVLLITGIAFYLWDVPAPSTEVRKIYTYDQLNQRSIKPQ